MCDRKEEKKDEWNSRIKDYWTGQEARAAATARRSLRSATLRATANARAGADAPRRPQAAAGNMTSTEENVKSMIAYMQKADDPMCARAAAARAPAAA